MGYLSNTIVIVPYRHSWPDEFMALAAPMRSSLGPLAVRIDHIGSTSVPGLAAKDLIDIQITVAELTPVLEAALNELGYARRIDVERDHVPPGGPDAAEQWAKWYFQPTGGRNVHVHVRVAGRANQRYPLLFRDYLRANAVAREAYAEVKRELARLHPDDVDAYYAVKDPVCDIIMAGAEVWAASSGWSPGPSGA